jgi:phage gpG-like protein
MSRTGIRFEGGRDGSDITRKLRAMAENGEDLTPVWPRVQRYISEVEGEQFETKGARLGTPWKPLTPEYRAWKIKRGDPNQPLVLTGSLRDSFMGKGRWAIRDWRTSSAKFGSRHPLAHIHSKGTDGGKIPARPILRATPEMKKHIKKIVRDHVMDDR